ncbi:MAG: hypothetical protein JXM79_25035 [Sedimentisphaerales bacterium]|nr:hypothetical protein [Sedimentisphaerales bacterium]
MKNRNYIIVIVVCLVLAGLIFYATRSNNVGGIESLESGKLIWVKCSNPDCGATYQMDEKDYFLQIHEQTRAHPMALQTPALVCKKCGKESVYKAFKCEKCGTIFFSGAVPNDFADRCPVCGYSKTEAIREARKASPGDS